MPTPALHSLWFTPQKEVLEIRRRQGGVGPKIGESLATGMEMGLMVWGGIPRPSILFPASFTTKCIPSRMGLPSCRYPLG